MIREFLDHLTARNFSPLTLRAYSQTLNSAEQAMAPTPLLSATPANLRTYFASLGPNAKPTTRLRHVAAIRSFALFLQKVKAPGAEVLIASAKGLRGPKRPASVPKALDQDQTQALVSYAPRPAPNRPSWQIARERALVLLLYGAGLRAAEALSLPADVDLTGGVLRVIGKGRRERLVPLLPVVAQALETYRAQRNPTILLFDGFSDRDLRRMMQRLREEIGLPETTSPHSLRHSFATHIYQSGGDIRTLADLMGHASVSTTAIYMKTDPDTLLRVLQRCAPERYGVNKETPLTSIAG